MKINQAIKLIKLRSRLQTGFSMLEAVVVVGVLLALAVGGLFSYGPITENAKMAAAKSSASQVYTALMVALIDGDPSTSTVDVVDQFNNSNSEYYAEIRAAEDGSSIPAMTTAGYTPTSENDFCLRVTNRAKPSIYAEMGACSTPVASTPTATPSPTATVSPTPTPTPTPTAPPADSNSDGVTISPHASFTSYFDNDTVVQTTQEVESFVFTVSQASNYADYEVSWSGVGLDTVNGSVAGRTGTDSLYWVGDVKPVDARGWTEGTTYVTATVKHLASGNISTKSWSLTTVAAQITAAGGVESFYENPSTLEHSTDMKYTVGTITGVDTALYTAEWSIGTGANAAITGRLNSNSSGKYWVGDIIPADSRGFVVGTVPITLKLTHVNTGTIITKMWSLTVKESDIFADSKYPTFFNDVSAPISSTVKKTFVYDLPGAMNSYTVSYTASNNTGTNSTLAGRTNTADKYWAIDVIPGAGGFKAGVTVVTATVTHIPTGEVYTEDFVLTIQ